MTLRQLLALALPYRWSLLWGGALLLAENGVALVLPWLAGVFAVQVLGPSPAATSLAVLLLLLLLRAVVVHFGLHDGHTTRIDGLQRFRMRHQQCQLLAQANERLCCPNSPT